jgi:hypothetical protein
MPEKSDSLQLQDITPTDLQDVARFICRASNSGTPLPLVLERLSWILLENPARVPGDPLGWLLRLPSGEVVGCMCCAPQKFCFGEAVLSLMMANSFYVDDRYRGGGTSIFLKYLQLGRLYPLFVSSANGNVAEMWRKLGGYPLGNSGHEVFGVLNWLPLVAERVYRRTSSDFMARLTAPLVAACLRVRRQLMSDSPPGRLVPLATPEDAADICVEHRSDKLTNCRDVPFLKWRYFSSVDQKTRLFAFRPRDEKKQFMVGTRLQNRGYKQQIRALQVLDLWGEPNPNTCLEIAASLWREYCDQIDMLVFRCLNPQQQQVLAANGFQTRQFAAPIAWCLDKYGLLPAKTCYFVPADGDMFL